jgi:hypothetical protein
MGATTTAGALVFAIATKFPALHPFTTTSIDTDREEHQVTPFL